MEPEEKLFHIPQGVKSCGGNVEESVENFSGKKRGRAWESPPQNRGFWDFPAARRPLFSYRSRIFLMMSSTIALVWGSFLMSFSTWRTAYTTVEWSRPPKVWPISTMDIWVISRTMYMETCRALEMLALRFWERMSSGVMPP